MRLRNGKTSLAGRVLPALLVVSAMKAFALPLPENPLPQLKVESSLTSGISYLSWDTEATGRERENLLRPGRFVEVRPLGEASGSAAYAYTPAARESATTGTWYGERTEEGGLEIRLHLRPGEGAEMVFPFNPRVTPTTVIASRVAEDRSLALPALVSAPDFGQMLLTVDGASSATGRLLGSRSAHEVDFHLRLEGGPSPTVILQMKPYRLDPPPGVPDDGFWRLARRGWFNVFQPTAQWGRADEKANSPAGVLGNNVISDPVSFALWTYADAAFWTPEPAPGISLMEYVRGTLDWWLDEKTSASGECTGYWAYFDFLDSNPSLLISAWDYVEATGNRKWLQQRIGKLEELSAFLEQRDLDGDGLVEAVQSGNRGTLQQPNRSSCWWDALNTGHNDGFSNALIYRAWRCLADLERQLGRRKEAARYSRLADRLKDAYARTLMNDETGWLGWWRSRDGELHDYASPVLNGLAVEYGLVDKDLARTLLERLRARAEAAGFHRPDLGIPSSLVPVHRSDYLLPTGLGIPEREDGTDTFGHYMNGGITAGHSLHWLAAHYRTGGRRYADQFLAAMLERQNRGQFQNGVTDEAPRGIDWTDWDGRPWGYEGYLSDNYRFLQAVVIRNRDVEKRLYRPLRGGKSRQESRGEQAAMKASDEDTTSSLR